MVSFLYYGIKAIIMGPICFVWFMNSYYGAYLFCVVFEQLLWGLFYVVFEPLLWALLVLCDI